jgi:hypothetical protein
MPIDDSEIFNTTASTGCTGFTFDDIKSVAEKAKAFIAETDRLDVELFKAVLRSGFTIIPCDYLTGRHMVLSVPQSMLHLVMKAKNDLLNSAAERGDESEAAK